MWKEIRDKKGREVLEFNCVRRIQRKEQRKRGGMWRAAEIMWSGSAGNSGCARMLSVCPRGHYITLHYIYCSGLTVENTTGRRRAEQTRITLTPPPSHQNHCLALTSLTDRKTNIMGMSVRSTSCNYCQVGRERLKWNLSHLIDTCTSCHRRREIGFEMEMCFRGREAEWAWWWREKMLLGRNRFPPPPVVQRGDETLQGWKICSEAFQFSLHPQTLWNFR